MTEKKGKDPKADATIAVHLPACAITVHRRDGDTLSLPSVAHYAVEDGMLRTTALATVRGHLLEVDGPIVPLDGVSHLTFDHSATVAALDRGIVEGTRRMRTEHGIEDFRPKLPSGFLRREQRADGAAGASIVLCAPPAVTVNNQIEAKPGEVSVTAEVPDREITLLENADGEISGASVKSKT